MARWFKVCRVEDLKPGQAQSISVGGRPFAVFSVGGELYGLEAACSHMKANLAAGRLSGDAVECAMHGWRYNVKTGECLTEPSRRLQSFIVKTEDEYVWIELDWPIRESNDQESTTNSTI